MKPNEFMRRWVQGIQEITPFQQARMTFWNTWIIVFGLTAGVIIMIIVNPKQFWWLVVILIAALVNTLIAQIGAYQKYKILKEIFQNE